MTTSASGFQEFQGGPVEGVEAMPRPADRPRVVPVHDPNRPPEPPLLMQFVGAPIPPELQVPAAPRPAGRERRLPGEQPSTPPSV